VKAILEHPCSESQYLMNYFDLAFHEMELLKDKINLNANNLIFNNRSRIEIGLIQWLDLGINFNQSIYDELGPEYGYFLRKNNYPRSNLTLDKVKDLFIVNDFNSKLPRKDDSASFLNKKNLDDIFQMDYNDSINFINSRMKINNFYESKSLREYLNYVVGDVAYSFSKGGTKAIGAIVDFLSTGFTLLFQGMGDDLYYGLMEYKMFNGFLNNLRCEDFVNNYILIDPKLVELLSNRASNITIKICGNDNLKTSNINNMKYWVNNILEGSEDLKSKIDLSDVEYALLKREDALVVKKFSSFTNEIINENNIITGNYKSFNRIKIAARQIATSDVTKNLNSSDSIKNWQNYHYKNKPEIKEFLKQYPHDNCDDISTEELFKISNSDNLFNTKFLTNLFIEYYNNKTSTNKFSKRCFIDYMRYIMATEVLNLFTKKSVYDLMWGYEDELLTTIVKLFFIN
jgi:hypothetical protein